MESLIPMSIGVLMLLVFIIFMLHDAKGEKNESAMDGLAMVIGLFASLMIAGLFGIAVQIFELITGS